MNGNDRADTGIDARLLEVLACPLCRSRLVPVEQALQCRNPGCRRRYPVRESIPVLLEEESEVLSQEDFDSLGL